MHPSSSNLAPAPRSFKAPALRRRHPGNSSRSGHWKTTTLIAAVRLDGITAPYVLDGPIDGDTFRAYVEQMPAPTLAPDDIVILDNLASHKMRGIREAIAATGAELLFLQL